MKPANVVLFSAGLSLVGFVSVCALAADEQPAKDGAKSKVSLQVVDWDETLKLVAAHKGKVVVLDAWSTSCPPCMKEFPNLVKLHHKYGGKQVVCMSLSCDYAGIKNKPPEYYRERVVKFLEKQE